MASTEIIYYQGETIGLYIEGDSVIDFDNNPFKVLYYNAVSKTQRVLLDKSDFVQISVNKYYAEIANTVTATLQRGQYIEEKLYGDAYTSISKENAFYLNESEIKKEL